MKHINHAPTVTSRRPTRSVSAAVSLLSGIFWIFHASARVVWAVRNTEEPSGPTGD
jgi:hypothetical protein